MSIQDDGYFNPIETEAIEPDAGDEEIVEGEESPEETEETEGEEIPEVEVPEEGDDDPIGNIVDDWMKNQSTESQAPRGEELELLTTINESRFMKELLRLKKEGYTDEQIQRGLGSTYSKMYGENKQAQAQQQEEQDEIDLTDPRQLAAFIQQQIQAGITPIAKQQEQKQYVETARQIQQHNDQVFGASLQKVGKNEPPNQEEIKAIRTVINQLYPGFDAAKYQLTSAQSDMIIGLALGKSLKKESRNKTITNNMKAPAIPSGKATSTNNGTTSLKPKTSGLSQSERAQNLNKIF